MCDVTIRRNETPHALFEYGLPLPHLEDGQLVAPVHVPRDGLGDMDHEQSRQRDLQQILL